MKNILVSVCTAGVLAVTLSHSIAAQANSHAAIEQAIKANEVQWNKDWAAKDVDKILAHYADDAVLIAPGSPAAHGKEAIRSALTQMANDPALSLKFETQNVAVARSGDMAYTVGSYTLTATDSATKKPLNDKGSYVTVYKKQADGSWKAIADIASSESPAGGSASK